LGVKQTALEADNLLPISEKFKMGRPYDSTYPYVFMACCLIRHTGKFIFISSRDR